MTTASGNITFSYAEFRSDMNQCRRVSSIDHVCGPIQPIAERQPDASRCSLRTWAIVPVKSLEKAKSRLSGTLNSEQRRQLITAMFVDVLSALQRVRTISSVLVVTSDLTVSSFVEQLGFNAILECEGRGLNSAVSSGVDVALRRGASRVVILPCDVPLIDSWALARVLEGEERSASVIVIPDRHGVGTNGLILSPPHAVPPQFGIDSFRSHCDLASSLGLSASTVSIDGAELDIDTPADLELLGSYMRNDRLSTSLARRFMHGPKDAAS